MPDPVDLSYAIGLEPQDAVEYFRQKGYAITWNWHQLWEEAHAKAFTVAKAMKLDILQDIRGAVDDAIAKGTTLSQFQDQLVPLLQKKGWWGKYLDDNEKTVQLGSPWRMETIFRANVQTAYMAGRYKQQMENADDRPYLQFVAVMDSRTRPEHAILNGKVFRFDDPFWNTHYPPLGFRCRCRTRALMEQQVKDCGLVVESGKDAMIWEDKLIGGKSQISRPVCAYQDPVTGTKIFTDPGWSSNPGREVWQPDFGKILAKMQTPKTWEYVPGTQKGSNPGGIWMGPDGKKYYGKVYANENQARREYLSSQLMKKLNIGAPESRLKTMDWEGKQRLVYLSEWKDGAVPLKTLMGGRFSDAAQKQLTKQFLNAALTNNWDFVGLDFDNLIRVGNKWYMIDAGGSFEFRAMGGVKGFGPVADAFDSMLQSGRNPAKVFNEILGKTLKANPDEYIKWLSGLTDRQIMLAVKEAGMDAQFAKILVARRDDIVRRIEAYKVIDSIAEDIRHIKQYMGTGYEKYLGRYVEGGVLNEVEYVITKGYTGNAYYHGINGSLIVNGGETVSYSFKRIPVEQLQAIERQMSMALDKLPKPEQDVVWRGVELSPDYVRKKFVEGKTVTLNGYQSASVSKASAFTRNTILEIKLTKKQGGMVQHISDVKSEKEFLLKSGLNYNVISVTYEQGIYYIKLEEI